MEQEVRPRSPELSLRRVGRYPRQTGAQDQQRVHRQRLECVANLRGRLFHCVGRATQRLGWDERHGAALDEGVLVGIHPHAPISGTLDEVRRLPELSPIPQIDGLEVG